MSESFDSKDAFIPQLPCNNLTTKSIATLHVTSYINNYCRTNKIKICQDIINLCINLLYDENAVSFAQVLKYLVTPRYVIDVYDFQHHVWKSAVYIHHTKKKNQIIVRFIPLTAFADSSFMIISDFPVNYIKPKLLITDRDYGFVVTCSNLPKFVLYGNL